MKSTLTKNQKQTKIKYYTEDGQKYKIEVTLRYDDNCGNGHNSFGLMAIIHEKTKNGRWREYMGGCCHEEIVKRFPEFEHLVKWHLCSTDGPMHYVANTVYLVGDKDCNGLRKNEQRQIRNGKTGVLSWKLVVDKELSQYIDSEIQPQETATQRYVPWYREGEGKARELDAARRTAIWPDATDEALISDGLKERLEARLPALLVGFQVAMENLGFTY